MVWPTLGSRKAKEQNRTEWTSGGRWCPGHTRGTHTNDTVLMALAYRLEDDGESIARCKCTVEAVWGSSRPTVSVDRQLVVRGAQTDTRLAESRLVSARRTVILPLSGVHLLGKCTEMMSQS